MSLSLPPLSPLRRLVPSTLNVISTALLALAYFDSRRSSTSMCIV